MTKRYLIIFLLLLSLGYVFLTSCSKKGEDGRPIKKENFEEGLLFIDEFLSDTVSTAWDYAEKMPDEGSIKLRINYPGGTLRKLFNDSNHIHYAVAENIGVEPFIDGELSLPLKNQLLRVHSNEYYMLDELNHSFPYLVPQAQSLLNEIGQRFHDTIQSRGGGPYRLKVTSLLRTRGSVSKLRRVNRASVDSSAHLFGTTFDISFTNFPYDGGEPHRTQEDLKNLLAEILYDVRREGKCYVIYEHRPGCFHITAR